MKKITLLAGLCALFMAPSLVAQEAQEIQYVEDETQGYVINDFKDNWFVTLGLGTNFYVSKHDVHRDITDRFAPALNLSVGKWFTPAWGARLNIEALNLKGLGTQNCTGYVPGEHMTNGYYKTRQAEIGPTIDIMANLTNLFCGYKPGRVYNATLYAGGGAYWTYVNEYDAKNEKDGTALSDRILTFRAGIINSFNVSKQVQLSLDLRASALDGTHDFVGQSNPIYLDLQAYLGVTYLFNNREWSRPVVPVCPEPVDCTPLINAAVADATADLKKQISRLQEDLRNAKGKVVTVTEPAPLATVYFPIGKSALTYRDNNVLKAVAEQMKATNDNYVIYGLADNVTGTDKINARLRDNRANNVKNQLVKYGVDASRLAVNTDGANLLSDSNEKYVSLDRAARIEVAK